jgi:ATP-dependent Clp protease ATP-binding subunit ClpC
MNDPYLTLYLFFNNRIILFVRIFLFVILSLILVLTGFDPSIARVLLVFYFVLLLHELFILDRVQHSNPAKTLEQPLDLPFEATTFILIKKIKDSASADMVVSKLLKEKQVRFIQNVLNVQFSLMQTTASVDDVLKKAVEIGKTIRSQHIHQVDFFVAYLLLTEEQTHFLKNLELKNEDLINVLSWVHKEFEMDADSFGVVKTNQGIRFSGFGVFDSLVYGWNVEIKKYAKNLTYHVLSQKFPPSVVGRSKEYEELLGYLSKDTQNNVVLVGEPGTGKTSLIEYFAYTSQMAKVPDNVGHKMIYELLVDELLAGANTKGEQEERITALIQDISHSGNVLLLIQNIENIFGGGGTNFDISGVLFEYLKNGSIQMIGTTTHSAYQTYLANKGSVANLFETIRLEEPDKPTALFMLFEKVPEIEQKYHVQLSYSAVKATIDLSASYFPDRYLPGKALALLENVVSNARINKKKRITKDDVVKEVETKTNIILEAPTQEEKDTLLHLEDEIHKRIVNQEQAVTAIASAMRRMRSGFAKENRPISTFLFLGPTGVGKTETAKALAQIYFHDENHMIRLDMSEYQTQEALSRLLGAQPGQEYIPSTLTEQVKEHPFSLILLDEFEKAHPHILDIFLQVFDDGRLTDNTGKTISFANTIIIATSNAGSELVRENVEQDEKKLHDLLIDSLLKNNIFKPELVNRFDEVVVFHPLSHEHIKQVVGLLLQNLAKQLSKQEITLQYDDAVVEKIIQEGYNIEFGARNIRRYIEGTIEELISKKILENGLGNGSVCHLSVNAQGAIILA